MSTQVEEPLTKSDVEDAVAELAALGGTADDVANALIAKGIKARRGYAHLCIIAEWLVTEGGLGEIDEIEVDGKCGFPGWHVSVWRGFHEGGKVDLPSHLGELAQRFDLGDWPELVTGWTREEIAEFNAKHLPCTDCPDCGGPTENLVGGARCSADDPCGWHERWSES